MLCSRLCFSQEVLCLGEALFDRIEIGGVGRQEDHVCTDFADCGARGAALVAAEIIENDHITGRECRGEDLFDIGGEGLAVDRTVEDARRIEPVGAQGRDEGERPPMTMRCAALQALATRSPPAQWCHVGLYPSLVDEDQPSGVNPPLMPPPARPPCRYLRTLRLAGQKGFF